MEKRCTTCHYFQIPYPKRYCAHPDNHVELSEVHKYCHRYSNYVEKTLSPIAPKITMEETMRKINFECLY